MNAVRSPFVVASSVGRDEPVARAVRVGIDELVLVEPDARVDVDEALDAGHPRVGGQAARVVVERREVGGARRGAVGPDRERQRRELALAEGTRESVEGGAGRDARRQDRRVRGVEPDVEERRAEQQQDRQRRQEDRDRAAHDPAREAGPRAVRVVDGHDPPDREGIDPGADDREDRRQQRHGGDHREEDDDGAGDPDGPQDHELEQDEPDQSEEHGQAGEEDRPPGRRDGRDDGVRHPVRLVRRPGRELLAESARHQQRVVDAEAQPEERREIEDEDAHRRDARDAEDRRERDDDRRPADDERNAGGDDRSEHEQERDRRQGQRDDLAPLEVRFRHVLDVAVERRPAGDLDSQPGRVGEALDDAGQRGRRVVRRDREEDDVVGGPAVGRHLARRERVRKDADDVRRRRHVLDRLGRGGLELRRAGCQRVAVVDDDDRRRRRVELLLQQRLRPGRFEVVEDEAAGPERADDVRGDRDRDREDREPRGDDPPAPPDGESTEAREETVGRRPDLGLGGGGHAVLMLYSRSGSDGLALW